MTDRPLNILIVGSWYPGKDFTTEGTFVAEQAELLKSKGHEVTVLHPYLLGSYKESFKKKKQILLTNSSGINVLHIGVPAVFPKFRNLTYKSCFATCLKVLQKFNIDLSKFDLIHSHAALMGGYIGMRLSEKFTIPLFHTEHASGLIFSPEQYNKTDTQLIRQIYRNSQGLFFVSQFAKEKILKNLNINNSLKIQVIPNLVADFFFEPQDQANQSSFGFLIIGNFVSVKNHALLLKAWSTFQKQFPDDYLTIVGEGPLKKDLKQMEYSLGLKNVFWHGRLGRKEIVEMINKHQVLLSSSSVETFGLSVAEAQALGKPVVATDSGGVRDIIEDSTGIITKQTSEAFAQGIIRIKKNFSEYNSKLIRERIHKKFSGDQIYLQLLKSYQDSI